MTEKQGNAVFFQCNDDVKNEDWGEEMKNDSAKES